MRLPTPITALLSSGVIAARGLHVPGPARVRDDPTSSTQCTSSSLATTTMPSRGNEGIYHVRANISDLSQLYNFRRIDWLDNDYNLVLDTCSDICLSGNDTTNPGSWLPSNEYFQGAFVNTPDGPPPDHIVWQCACYDRPLSSNDLAAGGGVWNNANPTSGVIINREC
ncbi:hypothetical protein F4779DRAFT_591283 [Xylariaceae sp. FL0662B]|nr:hypothetical protein F4779DRAFT_591283 [Xylariaceae sp. FL0662B]